jgi:hypothetical protein
MVTRMNAREGGAPRLTAASSSAGSICLRIAAPRAEKEQGLAAEGHDESDADDDAWDQVGNHQERIQKPRGHALASGKHEPKERAYTTVRSTAAKKKFMLLVIVLGTSWNTFR